MYNEADAKNFVKKFITEVWCEQNINKIAEHYTLDFVGLLNGSETFNYNDLIKRVEFSKKSFAKNNAEFHDTFVISETRIGARVSMHRLDFGGNESHVNIFMVIELAIDKVQKIWLFTDQDYKYKSW